MADLPSWLSRKVYSFANVTLDGQERTSEEYFFNPAIYKNASGKHRFLGRYVANGRRELIGLPLDRDLAFASQTAHLVSNDLRAKLPGVFWYADPRHFTFAGRDYITLNNGQDPIPNDIYVVEMDDEGRPQGPAYTLVKADGRQPLEKNWGFFEHDGLLYCVYSIQPFVVLACAFEGDKIVCRTAFEHQWDADAYESAYGEPHGGSCPVLIDGRWYMVVQSRYPRDHDCVYRATLMAFEDAPPFRPLAFSDTPLFDLAEDELPLRGVRNLHAKLKSCFYPAGLVWDPADDTLLISYGINDFASGVRRYGRDALVSRLRDVLSTERRHVTPTFARKPDSVPRTGKRIRTFFWDARTSPGFRHGNVGDQLQELLISRLYGAEPVNDDRRGNRLLGVGSVSHRMLRGDLLWGTGCRASGVPPKELAPADAETIDVRAVRGPLTREYLKKLGINVDRVTQFFDPGLLIGEIFREQLDLMRKQIPRQRTMIFIPHHYDRRLFVQQYGRLGFPIINVDCNLMNFCAAIASTTLVIASSLHGIILAEAMGVPALMHKPMGGEPIEKFYDYYYGTDRMSFPVVENFPQIATVDPPPLPKFKYADWLATLPSADDLAQRGILS